MLVINWLTLEREGGGKEERKKLNKNIILYACIVSFPSSSFELLLLWMSHNFCRGQGKRYMVIIKIQNVIAATTRNLEQGEI